MDFAEFSRFALGVVSIIFIHFRSLLLIITKFVWLASNCKHCQFVHTFSRIPSGPVRCFLSMPFLIAVMQIAGGNRRLHLWCVSLGMSHSHAFYKFRSAATCFTLLQHNFDYYDVGGSNLISLQVSNASVVCGQPVRHLQLEVLHFLPITVEY